MHVREFLKTIRELAKGRVDLRAFDQVEDSVAIVDAIEELRREEGAAVTICCQNPEGSGPDNEAVEVVAYWTNWQPLRFQGQTLRLALEGAIAEKREKTR